MIRKVPARVATIAAVAALAPAGVAIATTPPDTAPPTTGEAQQADTTMPPTTESVAETSAPGTTTEAGQAAAAGVTVFGENGNPEATITLIDAVSNWSGYAEADAPEGGKEYLRIEVRIQSMRAEEDFSVNVDDFVLQNIFGFLTTAQNIRTAEQVEDDAVEDDAVEDQVVEDQVVEDQVVEDVVEVPDGADLGPGESIDLALTFEVNQGVPPDTLLFRPSDDQIVDVFELRPTDEEPGDTTETTEPAETTEPVETTEPGQTTQPSDTTELGQTTEPGETTEPE